VSGFENGNGSEKEELDNRHKNFLLAPYFKMIVQSLSYFASWSERSTILLCQQH